MGDIKRHSVDPGITDAYAYSEVVEAGSENPT